MQYIYDTVITQGNFYIHFTCFHYDIIPHEYLNTVLVADAAGVLILFITVAIFSKTRFSLIFLFGCYYFMICLRLSFVYNYWSDYMN